MSFSGTKGYVTNPMPGVMINPSHPLSQGLMRYWLFNEGVGSSTCDISGHGSHGELKNMLPNTQGTGWAGSDVGSMVECDGTNDYIDCGKIPLSTMTIDVIYKLTSIGGGWNILVAKEIYNDTTGFYSVHDGNHLHFYYKASGDVYYETIMDRWVHATFTWDGTTLIAYVDGEHEMSDTSVTPVDADVNLFFGCRHGNDGSGTADNSPMQIKSARVYNRALTQTEIKQLHQDPFCNLLRPPIRRYYVSAAGPAGAIMNQFQNFNIGADLYNGGLIA